MKKTMAWLLVFCLIAGCVLPAGAKEAEGTKTQKTTDQEADRTQSTADQEADKTQKTADQDEDAVSGNDVKETISPAQEDKDWNDKTPAGAKGGVRVYLMNALPVYEDIALNISLEDASGQVSGATKAVVLPKNSDAEPEKKEAFFEELEPGTYRLRAAVSDDSYGFLPFEQDILVGSDVRTLEVYTGAVELPGVAYEAGAPHPGVMLLGDVNRDGKIDGADKNEILKAISEGSVGAADLDKDGKTDLVDLQYYTNSKSLLDQKADVSASVTGAVPAGAVQVNINEESTALTGDVDLLLTGDGAPVQLKNKNGGDISEENPVEIGFNLEGGSASEPVQMEEVEISVGENGIKQGEITVETETEPVKFVIADGKVQSAVRTASLQEEAEGAPLRIDLGGRTAVKRITIKITGTFGGNLAEITRVEFLNDTENRIPEPDLDRPENVRVTLENKGFQVSWDPGRNVTGYEVEISRDGVSERKRAASNGLQVKSFQNDKLQNGVVYKVKVRSVNGTWTSPWSDETDAVPVVTKKPDAPDNLKASVGASRISLSWKLMEDTDSYNIYYRENGKTSYAKIAGVKENRYVIYGLKELTTYEIYVTGVNDIGESAPSLTSEVRTTTIKPAEMPNYKLLNTSNGKGKLSAHIVSVSHMRGTMVGSVLDQDDRSASGVADKDAASYYQVSDWDDGAEYVSGSKGLLFTLDDYYKMNYITFAEPEDIASYGKVSVYYYDKEHPDGTYAKNVSVMQRMDKNGRKYYLIKLNQAVEANKIRLGFARAYALRNITVAEVNFYHYDSLEDDIMALYADDLHTKLQADVTKEKIDDLQKRLDTKDEASGEYHPEREMLQRELDNARGLLTEEFDDIVMVDPKINSKKDGHLGFSGLNGWQPLGVTAYEGEQLVIYVGHDELKTGTESRLNLIATQYHAEAASFASKVATLRVGRNEITIPELQTIAAEGGGALYVEYTGDSDEDRYAVRVSGGAKEPVLDLHGVTDEETRKRLIGAYVKELEEHVANLENAHREIHETAPEGNKVNRTYDEKNCVLGATDIVLDQMMLSVSAKQILAGLGGGTTEERAEKLNQSLLAMDGMMELFYQHKGLGAGEGVPSTDRLPARHLNIRYMRMFAGAFMYASGNHIGIEWGSVSGLSSGKPVTADEKGRYVDGNYFGWGISHEIGHNINQGNYAIAEVTNNYFAQLTKSKDSNDTVRFDYNKVYEKVTSGTVGHPTNVFTHLAMYWQLHLAYDRDYNYKTYDSYEEQLENLFYARVDSYSRNPAAAEGGLKLDGGSDQNFMRLACAAAKKDLTDFFVRWGLVPDEETVRYASQFEKEERALYYLTDDARVYEMEKGITGSVKGENVISSDSSVKTGTGASNEVKVSIRCTADPASVLGYEITRVYYENGRQNRQVAGFTTDTTYVDHVSSINNRVLTYEATAVDQFGFRSNTEKIGEVKISHDGSLDKSMWEVTTNMTSEEDAAGEGVEEDPCEPEPVLTVSRVADNDYKNTYTGKTAEGDAQIVIGLGRERAVCGLKYTLDAGTPVGKYEIDVSADGSNWTNVKKGRFKNEVGSQTVYFENADKDPWICTYDAAYVRLRAAGQSTMAVSEIDLLGPAGDNITFGAKENSTEGAVGILQEDYTYEEGKVIPRGSLIFTGSYKGNPAYNMVVLYDEEGGIVGGLNNDGELEAEQIILAKLPDNDGMMGEVSDGIWIYWIEEGLQADLGGKKVRAQLYRVDNALTNEGQRVVSDTAALVIPEELPRISLRNDKEE